MGPKIKFISIPNLRFGVKKNKKKSKSVELVNFINKSLGQDNYSKDINQGERKGKNLEK